MMSGDQKILNSSQKNQKRPKNEKMAQNGSKNEKIVFFLQKGPSEIFLKFIEMTHIHCIKKVSDYIVNLVGKVLSVRVYLQELTLRDFRGAVRVL